MVVQSITAQSMAAQTTQPHTKILAEPVAPEVSIVIVSYNTSAILRDCLRSIGEQTRTSHEIIVVDNNSPDDTCQMIRNEFPMVRLVANTENAGFARANNQGLAEASGKYILFLNPDTIILRAAIDTMVAWMASHPTVGLVGPHVLNNDGISDQASILRFPTVKRLFHTHVPLFALVCKLFGIEVETTSPAISSVSMPVEAVLGCCMLMPTSLARRVGGMNETYFMYSEEYDLAEAVHATGYEVYYLHEATIIHLGGASTDAISAAMAVELLRSMMRYFRRVSPASITPVRVLYTIGSLWRFAAWKIAGVLLPSWRDKAQAKAANHAAMLRWLAKEFDF